jgi:protein-tyrosine phosphatase
VIQILMVCLGNICRSPMAQAIATHHAEHAVASPGGVLLPWVRFESAGTRPGLVGALCDPRARAALQRKGYAAPSDRCRRVTADHFETCDLILAMDRDNLADLLEQCPAIHQHKVRLFLDFAKETDSTEVPDPYYGDAKGFDRVLELCEAGSIGLIQALLKQHAVS